MDSILPWAMAEAWASRDELPQVLRDLWSYSPRYHCPGHGIRLSWGNVQALSTVCLLKLWIVFVISYKTAVRGDPIKILSWALGIPKFRLTFPNNQLLWRLEFYKKWLLFHLIWDTWNTPEHSISLFRWNWHSPKGATAHCKGSVNPMLDLWCPSSRSFCVDNVLWS